MILKFSSAHFLSFSSSFSSRSRCVKKIFWHLVTSSLIISPKKFLSHLFFYLHFTFCMKNLYFISNILLLHWLEILFKYGVCVLTIYTKIAFLYSLSILSFTFTFHFCANIDVFVFIFFSKNNANCQKVVLVCAWQAECTFARTGLKS